MHNEIVRSDKTVRYYRNLYEPFDLRLLAIAPRDKTVYTNVDVWRAFKYGANFAIDYDDLKHISFDMDLKNPPKVLRELLYRTLSWETGKGFGLLLSGPVPKVFYDALHAIRKSDRVEWNGLNEDDFERGLFIRKRFEQLGIRDFNPFHGLFKYIDGFTYILGVPSRTCRFQGYKGQRIRTHSSNIPFCNQSPTGRHHYFTRRFVNFTYDLLSFEDFMDAIGITQEMLSAVKCGDCSICS